MLMGLFGLLAFRNFGLRKIGLGSSAGRSHALLVAAVIAPLVSLALMLDGIATMMGQSVGMLDWATIEAITMSTSMGWAFIARMALMTSALLAIVLMPSSRGISTSVVFYGLALLTLGWSGHAAATEGWLGLGHRFNNGLHLLAAAIWIGAIGWFLHLTLAAHRNPDSHTLVPLLGAMHRFAPLGIALVAIVAATGLINAQLIFGLGNSAEALGTAYGWLLIAKLALVAAMLLCAARNAAISRNESRTADMESNSRAKALASLRGSLATEMSLAIGVLALVAFVGMASPMG
ncbi:hypothetical protein GRI99_17940 [Altererythrobacter buctensis]|uniref:Copper resistance protein D domain-containing protein n=2 Tax=Alteraurantiacibacter buctensis TaxID=1503981 RepID=A0A844Z1W3_9SPHN|nr:hypothetical protein [Alteraurantiacibacter buctensis]